MAGGVRPMPLMIPDMFGAQGQPLDIDAIVAAQGLQRPGRPRAFLKVYLNGQDLTDRLNPYVLSARITDKKFGASEAALTLDDRYGELPNPPDGAQVLISLGWPDEGAPKQFFGYLSGCWCAGQRQQGRTMDVTFTGNDQTGPGKTPVRATFGTGKDGPNGPGEDIPFSKVAEELAKLAKIQNFKVAPAIGNITRKHWSIDNETPLGALDRLAKELGGSGLKVDGPNAGIAAPRSNQAADGSPITGNTCIVGENVLAWRIIPKVARAQWGSLWHGFFNRDKASPEVMSDSPLDAFGFGAVQAKRMAPFPTNDADMAKTSAKSDTAQALQKRGTGWIVVDGMPTATSGGMFLINGCKPGVDGQYTGEEVESSYYRGGGYTTRIDVEDPQLYSGPASRFQGAPN